MTCDDIFEGSWRGLKVSGEQVSEAEWNSALLTDWRRLAERLLDPEDLGHAVSDEVRGLVHQLYEVSK
jgi:hypothetical protein